MADRKQPGRAFLGESIAALSRRALGEVSLPALMDEAAAAVVGVLGAEFSEVSELLTGGNALLLRAGTGWKEGRVGQATVGAGTGSPAGYAFLQHEPILFEDLASEARFRTPVLLHEHEVSSGIVVPIMGFDNPFGTLAAYSSLRRVWSREETYFLQVVANILAQALDRARLEEALRRRAEELDKAEQRKDDFLRMLSHELRNPLDSISLSLEVMRIYRLADPAREELRGVLDRQVRHMTRLVDDLLDVSRVQSGQIELRKTPIDISSVVNHALEATRPLIDDRGHAVSLSTPPQPAWVKADGSRLEQVLTNLLSNASKYTPPGGTIDVITERVGDEVVIRVRDNGKGIPADLLPHVFDLFTQEDRSLDRARGGLGIGLTVARKIVEMHGGSVEAHSEGPGKGSEFVVRLPLLIDAREEEAPSRGETSGTAVSAPRRVLLVDDNVDAAMMLATILAKWGHQVHMVHDGPAAMDVVHAYRPEVLLLDIGLPGIDGFEIARRLRREQGMEGLILVALTGYGQQEDRRRSREVGFDYHLTKPVDLDALQGLLARVR